VNWNPQLPIIDIGAFSQGAAVINTGDLMERCTRITAGEHIRRKIAASNEGTT
jgi:hypothetical protein